MQSKVSLLHILSMSIQNQNKKASFDSVHCNRIPLSSQCYVGKSLQAYNIPLSSLLGPVQPYVLETSLLCILCCTWYAPPMMLLVPGILIFAFRSNLCCAATYYYVLCLWCMWCTV